MLAGQPERALPLLAGAAATAGQVGPALDVMLGQARRAFAGLTAVAPAQLAVTVTADVTPDGRRIITSSGLGELRAWDPVTGALAWSAGGALYAALSPDGRWVLSAASDGAISARAAHDGAEVGRWHLLRRPTPIPTIR
ncbi:MAG: hypothetical protein HS111_32870 [Kofleriaceae bacterium]|nr:hypothetical protein [Kofleriaceae bacterium]